MKALILAAGFGTRLAPYTDQTPKPLFTIGGRPLLDILIRRLQAAGCEAVIVNTHHLYRQIEAFIADRQYAVPVSTRYEPRILGTGGAIRNAADFWDDRPFFVINSDIVFDIELKRIYRFHLEHTHPATLVLCDHQRLNSVAVDENGFIAGFENRNRKTAKDPSGLFTFTGIQVIDPELIDFIPDNTFSSIIDAYRAAISKGLKIRAFISQKGCWTDVGTPERYTEAVLERMSPEAFRIASPGFSPGRIDRIKLKGDGSDRKWYRLRASDRTVVLADHGIFRGKSPSEADSFVAIGTHLNAVGISVPKIYHYDLFSGMVFLEDLGDVILQDVILRANGVDKVISCYERVIDAMIRMSLRGAQGFDTAWTYQTPEYDKKLILEKECGYFVDAFLRGYLGMDISAEDMPEGLKVEFEVLADRALENAVIGFMHRDMQSRNIMVKEDRFYFIDFQGGRIGPIQYDLASLLIDPYVDLPGQIGRRLMEYATDRLSSRIPVDKQKFYTCFDYCAIARNLQILGAFGFLSRVKKKPDFEQYIPAAVRTLSRLLKAGKESPFPVLSSVLALVVEKIAHKKL